MFVGFRRTDILLVQLPPACGKILCPLDQEAIWDEQEARCICTSLSATEEVRNLELRQSPSVCPTIKCSAGFHPLYHPETENCSCERDPDPETCPTIRCMSGYHALYIPDSQHCVCEPNSTTEEPQCEDTYCAGGTKGPVYNPTTKLCSCEVLNPVPATCPQMKCKTHKHVVFHPELNKCTCDEDCPGLVCLVTREPTYNATTNTCSCVLIPGMEGTPSVGVEDRDVIAPEDPSKVPTCSEIMCLDEKYPMFNTTTQSCQCVWRTGMEPVPTRPLCGETMCEAEKEPIYNMSNGLCYCEWLPPFFDRRGNLIAPTRLTDNSEDGISTVSSSGALPTKTRIPTPLPSQCPKMVCISEKYVVYDPKTERCSCVWLPGIGPSAMPSLNSRISDEERTVLHDPCAGKNCSVGFHLVNHAETHSCSCEPIFGNSTTILPTSFPTSLLPITTTEPYLPTLSLVSMPTSASLPDPESIPACYNVTIMDWIRCPGTNEPEVWSSDGHGCVCREGGTTSITSRPTTTSEPTISTFSTSTVTKTSSSWTKTKTSTSKPTPTPTGGAGECRGMFCISEQRPVWDEEEGRCVCEWIEGFGPGGVYGPSVV